MPSLAALPSLLDSPYGAGVSKVTKATAATPLPRWATVIAPRRMDDLGVSQERIVADSADALTQTDVSRIERGKLHPIDDLPIAKFFGLLRGYNWTLDAFQRDTGLTVSFTNRAQAEALEAARYLETSPTYIKFPVYDAASAGESEPAPIDGGVAYILKEKLKARGADPRYVVVYRVNGDCMVSQEARMMERNIVHGDHIGVDTRRKPEPGDTVVAWWPADQKLVVKRYRVEREGILLYPLAPSAPTLVLPHEDDVNIIGTVIWREG